MAARLNSSSGRDTIEKSRKNTLIPDQRGPSRAVVCDEGVSSEPSARQMVWPDPILIFCLPTTARDSSWRRSLLARESLRTEGVSPFFRQASTSSNTLGQPVLVLVGGAVLPPLGSTEVPDMRWCMSKAMAAIFSKSTLERPVWGSSSMVRSSRSTALGTIFFSSSSNFFWSLANLTASVSPGPSRQQGETQGGDRFRVNCLPPCTSLSTTFRHVLGVVGTEKEGGEQGNGLVHARVDKAGPLLNRRGGAEGDAVEGSEQSYIPNGRILG